MNDDIIECADEDHHWHDYEMGDDESYCCICGIIVDLQPPSQTPCPPESRFKNVEGYES